MSVAYLYLAVITGGLGGGTASSAHPPVAPVFDEEICPSTAAPTADATPCYIVNKSPKHHRRVVRPQPARETLDRSALGSPENQGQHP